MRTDRQAGRQAETERRGQGLWIKPQTATFKAKRRSQTLGREHSLQPGLQPGPGAPPLQRGCWGDRLTSAVGKMGTANCSSPATWICMAVRERWNMVSAWARTDRRPTVRFHFPSPPAAKGPFLCSPPVPAPPALKSLTMALPACRKASPPPSGFLRGLLLLATQNGPRTGLTLELVRNVDSRAPPQTCFTASTC